MLIDEAHVGVLLAQQCPDLAGLPFADLFVRDAAGACLQQPPDLGAFEVP